MPFTKTATSLALFLLLSASAHAEDQFFPPANIPECRPGTFMVWHGPGHDVRCQDLMALIPDCGEQQVLTKRNGSLVCVDSSASATAQECSPNMPHLYGPLGIARCIDGKWFISTDGVE